MSRADSKTVERIGTTKDGIAEEVFLGVKVLACVAFFVKETLSMTFLSIASFEAGTVPK